MEKVLQNGITHCAEPYIKASDINKVRFLLFIYFFSPASFKVIFVCLATVTNHSDAIISREQLLNDKNAKSANGRSQWKELISAGGVQRFT